MVNMINNSYYFNNLNDNNCYKSINNNYNNSGIFIFLIVN